MKIKKITKPFSCPKCKKDLRKEGIIANEIGSQSHFIKYNSKGHYKSDEFWDGETDEYTIYCGNCQAKLDLELGDVWDTLPETKIELAE